MKDDNESDEKPEDREQPPARMRTIDRAASGAPASGWAVGDQFSWEEVHHRLLATADEEIAHSPNSLFFSGLTAGFAIVLTFLGVSVGKVHFPDNPFAASLLYPIGFLYIILGRYQLYTENTLSPVKLVLTRLASLPLLLRLWGIVLVANLLGAALGALVLANTNILPTGAGEAATHFVNYGMDIGWGDTFFKAVFAGWLVAGVVWLGTAVRDAVSRLLIIYVVFYTIAVTGLYHIISASCEVFYVLFSPGGPGVLDVVLEFMLPVLLGNTVGGVAVFTAMSYAQAEERRFPEVRELSLREIFFSWKGGRPMDPPRPKPPWGSKTNESP